MLQNNASRQEKRTRPSTPRVTVRFRLLWRLLQPAPAEETAMTTTKWLWHLFGAIIMSLATGPLAAGGVLDEDPFVTDPAFWSGQYRQDNHGQPSQNESAWAQRIVRLTNGRVIVAGRVPASDGSASASATNNLGLSHYDPGGAFTPGEWAIVNFPNSPTALLSDVRGLRRWGNRLESHPTESSVTASSPTEARAQRVRFPVRTRLSWHDKRNESRARRPRVRSRSPWLRRLHRRGAGAIRVPERARFRRTANPCPATTGVHDRVLGRIRHQCRDLP